MIRIDKERTWIFSPENNVAFKVDIKGNIEEKQIKTAIDMVVNSYEMLQQKIVFDQSGNAYYDKAEGFHIVIKAVNNDWKETMKEQERIPFALDQGEMIRFFYQLTNTGVTLLIIAHHIAGDGLSFTYLVQDILRALGGMVPDYKELQLYDMTSLPKESKLRFPVSWLLKNMNNKWKKTGKQFGFGDFYAMYDKYWSNHETLIETFCLENEAYDALCRFSKEKQITVNSLLTTALIRAAQELSDVGLAISIREKGYTGMGNYATGISVRYLYNEKKSFSENAAKLQNMIYQKINNPAKKYFLLQFMGQMEPTLIDAVYFEACGEYKNKTSGMFSNMFGYNGNPKGISITNLTNLDIDTKYKEYEITDFIFIPPMVLNTQRIIGVASFNRKMNVSLHLNCNDQIKQHQEFFRKGMDYLMHINV